MLTHICVSKLGPHCFRKWPVAYSPLSFNLNQCWGIVNWSLGTSFSEISMEIQNFLFMKMHLKTPSAKWQPFCPGGDELTLLVPRVNPMVTIGLIHTR